MKSARTCQNNPRRNTEAQRPRDHEALRPRDPENQRPRGPEAQRPKDQETQGPSDPGTCFSWFLRSSPDLPIREIAPNLCPNTPCFFFVTPIINIHSLALVHVRGRIALAGRIALQFYQRFLVLQLSGLIFFKHVISNKQIIAC